MGSDKWLDRLKRTLAVGMMRLFKGHKKYDHEWDKGKSAHPNPRADEQWREDHEKLQRKRQHESGGGPKEH